MSMRVDRRGLLAGIAILLGGCATRGGAGFYPLGNSELGAYGPIDDHGHEIPGLDMSRIDPGVLRRRVAFAGPYRPGTIVVNIGERHLYFVEPDGMAMRYTVGVGREEALNFRGNAVVGRKAEWPHWTPTADMIRRMPVYAHYRAGLPGGIDNPLGARALYLYRGNQDTYFRLHGTNEPETIGQKVSSGCIRLLNHDIIDLYNRAPVGTHVVVLQEGEPMRAEARAEAAGDYDPYGSLPGPYASAPGLYDQEPPGPYASAPGPYDGPPWGRSW
ncbi:MAG TPA: L,D-transpeptidase [Roseiarcus sp.]|jgi:lipoprotein-anchoring transpeptidase ErfK/SrfK